MSGVNWVIWFILCSLTANALSIIAILAIVYILIVTRIGSGNQSSDYHTYQLMCLLFSDFAFSLCHVVPYFNEYACIANAYIKQTMFLSSLQAVCKICSFMYGIIIHNEQPRISNKCATLGIIFGQPFLLCSMYVLLNIQDKTTFFWIVRTGAI